MCVYREVSIVGRKLSVGDMDFADFFFDVQFLMFLQFCGCGEAAEANVKLGGGGTRGIRIWAGRWCAHIAK